jgi:hypothetical protein
MIQAFAWRWNGPQDPSLVNCVPAFEIGCGHIYLSYHVNSKYHISKEIECSLRVRQVMLFSFLPFWISEPK